MEISARLRRWLSAVRPDHLRAAAAAAAALALPLAVWWLLGANLSIALLLGLTGAVVALQIAAAFAPARAVRPLRWTAAGASALFGASILIGILITPFSSYRLWFAEVHAGTQQGAVSNLFALIAGWAFSSASGVVLSSGFGLAAAVLAVLVVGLAALIVQSPVLYLLTVAAVVLALIVLGSRGVERTGGSVLFAAAIVLLAAGVGLLFPSAGGGNYFVDLVLHPRMRGAISTTFPRFPLLYSIPGFGTQHEERRLGGTPVLSPLPLLRVYSAQGRTIYLRTEVFDYYDGATWAFTQEEPADATDTERYIVSPLPLEGLDSDVQIELLADAYDRLPHTVDTVRFAITPYGPELAVADYARGFFPKDPILRGVSITLRRDPVIRTLAPPTDSRYLQVPASLPPEVRELANEVTQGAVSATGRLRSVERFLKSSCVYSLTPPTPRRDEDFIGHFLLGERLGYCVHFATAFTIFARINGIPARYVSGFLVHFPVTSLDAILTGVDELDDPDIDVAELITTEAVVTGLAAHTWAEVWLDQHGWTTWEATPAVNPGFVPNLGQADAEELSTVAEEVQLDSATARQLSSMLGRQIRAERHRLNTRPLLAGAAALILLAAVWAVVRLILSTRASLRTSPIGRVAHRYIKLGARAGIPLPDTTGWLSWERSFGTRLPEAARSLRAFVGLFVRVAYAGYQPTAAEVAGAARQAGTVRRIWYRRRLRSLRPGGSADRGRMGTS